MILITLVYVYEDVCWLGITIDIACVRENYWEACTDQVHGCKGHLQTRAYIEFRVKYNFMHHRYKKFYIVDTSQFLFEATHHN